MTTSAVERLVDAIVEELYPALGILFVSGASIQKFSIFERERHVVVLLQGDLSLAREAISLARNKLPRKFQGKLEPLIKATKAIPSVTSQLLKAIHLGIEGSSLDPENITQVALSYASVLADKDVIEGIAAETITHLSMIHQRQAEVLRDPNVVRMLSGPKLKILEPRLQVGVCPSCHHFELVYATSPRRTPQCSNCNKPDVSASVYLLDEEFARHKLQNKDLPLFIKEFLHRTSPQLKVSAFKHMSAKQMAPELEGDIDVYVGESKSGIECKLFLNPTPAPSQMESYVKEVSTAARKYYKAGIKRFFLATNLSQRDADEMKSQLLKTLMEGNCNFKTLEVLPGSVPQLMDCLRRLVYLDKTP